MRRAIAVLISFALLATGWADTARAGLEEIDYATYDARVTDVKGIATDLTGFGHATGPNVLMGYRGEAEVDIPFRLIRAVEVGDYVPENRRAPVKVILRSGKSVAIEIDNIEEMRLLRGRAEFGEYRIRFGKIRTLELFALSHTDRSLRE